MEIEVIPIETQEASKFHQVITKDLPEFFGLSEANEKYARGIEKCFNLGLREGDTYLGL